MKSPQQYLRELARITAPFLILAAGILGYTALASQRQPPESREVEETLPLVETQPVKLHSEGLDLSVDGVVVPFREITLSAEVAGRITSKSPQCRAGKYVTAGTPLLEIDERSYQLAVKRLQDELSQAEHVLQELKVEVSNFDALIQLQQEDVALKQRDLKRVEQLFARNVINESEYDVARATELQSRNTLQSVQNQRRAALASQGRLEDARELAKTRLAEAMLDLEKAKIVAPVDGMIVSETVEAGQFVSVGTTLLKIEDTSAAEVSTSLRMEEMNWIWQQGQSLGMTEERTADRDYQLPHVPATITYTLGGMSYQWTGMLWRYEGIGLNERTRTVPVRILVDQPRAVTATTSQTLGSSGPKALVRGMFVKVTLHTQPNTPFLEVPERAVQPGNVLWTVREGRLHQVRMQNFRYRNPSVLISAIGTDLTSDDVVVVSPLLSAEEGLAVELRSQQ